MLAPMTIILYLKVLACSETVDIAKPIPDLSILVSLSIQAVECMNVSGHPFTYAMAP